MLQISIDLNKRISSLGKLVEVRIEKIIQEYRIRLYDTLETFRPMMEQIAIEQTKAAGAMATSQLIDSYKTILTETANTMTLQLINDAHDPDWDVYYWRVINDGRGKGLTAPPKHSILEWMKEKHIQRQRRSQTTGRFIKGRVTSQAFAIAKSIGKKGIKARPEIFTQMRNKIYLELRKMLTTRLGVING